MPRLADDDWDLGRHLQRLLLRQRKSVRALTGDPGAELKVGPVHDNRIACRRISETIDLFAPLLDPAQAAKSLRAAKAVRKALAPLREADVGLARLRTLGAERLDASADEARSILIHQLHGRRKKRQRQGGRKCVRAAGRLRRATKRLAVDLPAVPRRFRGQAGARAFLNGRVAERLARVRAGVGPAAGGSLEAVHDLRITIKRLRYALEIARELGVAPTTAPALSQLRALQDAAGDSQDFSDLELTIATAQARLRRKPAGRNAAVGGGVIDGLERLLQVVVAAREEATDAFIGRLKSWPALATSTPRRRRAAVAPVADLPAAQAA